MTSELYLRFPDESHVLVAFDGDETARLPFASPLVEDDRRELRWYLEVYCSHSLAEVDDARAGRVATRLPDLGRSLFEAVFHDPAARRLFHAFQDREDAARVLTVSAEHPAVLSLPWELLHDPSAGGVFLFRETPRISIRRRVPGLLGGRRAHRALPKDRLHLLFVVSRPEGVGFLDPRADPGAVLDALDAHAAGRVSWEFLRPATLAALVDRLEDGDLPAVDILHFDGHGAFDGPGGLPARYQREGHRPGLRDELVRGSSAAGAAGTGYLLFETADGGIDFVTAQGFAENLHRQKVSLVILSACQTARMDEASPDLPMASVAARLTAAGIPAVLAMAHNVLVETTRALFGEMYKELARHRQIGEALDNARRALANAPQKFQVYRGARQVWLELQDWFVPTLYQAGPDLPLLRRKPVVAVASPPPRRSDPLKTPVTGFFGRRRELWEIERWLTGPTRRITITGLGGQGKTALALEAGRWLTRTGVCDSAVLLDYSLVQNVLDPVGVAVSHLASVLERNLPDPATATQALGEERVLLILDNLESLPEDPLAELLTAAAAWSEAGGSRVLLTTRHPDFRRPEDYPIEGNFVHRRILLQGLGSPDRPEDALAWFAALHRLPPPPCERPPGREELVELFTSLRFHPLAIQILARQLKTAKVPVVTERLRQILAAGAPEGAETEAVELAASLQLLLAELDEDSRRAILSLGVFEGGALESNLVAVIGLGTAADEPPAAPALLDRWQPLRHRLEEAGLVSVDPVPGADGPFLAFHPVLAPALWAQLAGPDQERLRAAHRRRYQAFLDAAYAADSFLAQGTRDAMYREIPNLLAAAHAAVADRAADAMDLVLAVTNCLHLLGMQQQAERLLGQSRSLVAAEGSESWALNLIMTAQQLAVTGRIEEAEAAYRKAFGGWEEAQGGFAKGMLLFGLGICSHSLGHLQRAESQFREGLIEAAGDEEDQRFWQSMLLTSLANILRDSGRFEEARQAYEESLAIGHRLQNDYLIRMCALQMGQLELKQGNLQQAAEMLRESLHRFQDLHEPLVEAAVWKLLGRTAQLAGDWLDAEHSYREASRLLERAGVITGPDGAAEVWNCLGTVVEASGNSVGAEAWYRKSIAAYRGAGGSVLLNMPLNNLAWLLFRTSQRLEEARELAEEALRYCEMADAAAAEPWKTLDLLAELADRSGQSEESAAFRRRARETRAAFPGTREELRSLHSIIEYSVAAATDPEVKAIMVAHALPHLEKSPQLAAALRLFYDGERNEEILFRHLDSTGAVILDAILRGLEDPASLNDLRPPAEEMEDRAESREELH